MTIRRYRYRLYPDAAQAGQLARVFGCVRVVFNDGLAASRAAHEAGEPRLRYVELARRVALSKRAEERAWLGEVTDIALQQSLRDLEAAYGSFFGNMAGRKRESLPVGGWVSRGSGRAGTTGRRSESRARRT